MKKIGILTFHYSNNYGGVLQAVSLQNAIKSLGYHVEIINYVPSNYNPVDIINNLGLSKNPLKNKLQKNNIINLIKKISIMKKNNRRITNKFNKFRKREMILNKSVDESNILKELINYDVIIVGSDQIWNPSQRKKPQYFLRYDDYKGKRISYAADSTISDVSNEEILILKDALNDFDFISVRNQHSYDFVKKIISKESIIVSDPTVLYDPIVKTIKDKKDYILTYILGKELTGTHENAINKIKEVYGDLPVYSIQIPTAKFELSEYADEKFYDLDPYEWLEMIKNAKFMYTDSFHGVLYSLKFNIPFLTYYTEKLRAPRFIDLGKRYAIEDYIVQSVEEIDEKKSLENLPDFRRINQHLKAHKEYSLNVLDRSISDNI